MYPEALRAHFAIGHVRLAQCHYSEAVTAFETALTLDREITLLGSLGHAYGMAGKVSEARALLTELTERAASEEVSSIVPAMIHIGLGEHERALALLEDAYRARDGRLFGVGTIPAFLSLGDNLGFRNLVRRLGLPSLPLK
jgi:lipopolysaccharide biosynthesis regulator YciM